MSYPYRRSRLPIVAACGLFALGVLHNMGIVTLPGSLGDGTRQGGLGGLRGSWRGGGSTSRLGYLDDWKALRDTLNSRGSGSSSRSSSPRAAFGVVDEAKRAQSKHLAEPRVISTKVGTQVNKHVPQQKARLYR